MPKNQIKKKTQIVFVPVFGLRLTKAVDRELQIGRVLFIEADKISRVRKRLGLKYTIGHYRNISTWTRDRLFKVAPVYACLKTRKDLNSQDFSSEISLIREAFWLLASSFFSITWRENAALSLHPYAGQHMVKDMYVFGSSGGFSATLSVAPPFIENKVNSEWRRLNRLYHFFDLKKILTGKIKIQNKWKSALIRASVLAGQSFLARHISEAFLCNMIAIEALLVQQGDKFPDVLIDRIVALFGWMTGEDPSSWEATVKRLYSLRCSYVHDGSAGDINGMDLFESDTLLKNLLLNLCKSTHYIKSKHDIITLANELQARRVIGMKPVRKVKRLHYMRPRIDKSAEKKINDINFWSW